MGLYVGPLRFTKRAVRARIGPRLFRIHLGAGGPGISSGAGPLDGGTRRSGVARAAGGAASSSQCRRLVCPARLPRPRPCAQARPGRQAATRPVPDADAQSTTAPQSRFGETPPARTGRARRPVPRDAAGPRRQPQPPESWPGGTPRRGNRLTSSSSSGITALLSASDGLGVGEPGGEQVVDRRAGSG